ncbi:hypothetical protein [Erythrobacter sp. KY5]|uniref:hypothetical protein n=1 Tax=Erythrobacter sp. KY5 TaxID=2011159 RepID=UPI0013A6F50D|nr:hypothetical protein [Erythrobacter sp. KY5]
MLEWIGLGGWIVSSFTTGAAGWLLAKKLGPLRPSHSVRQSVARIGPFFTLTLDDESSRFARNENRRSGDQPVALPSRSRMATAYEYTSPRAKARQTMFAQMPPLNELREEVEAIRQAERSGAPLVIESAGDSLPVATELASMDVLVNYRRAIARLRSRRGDPLKEEVQHEEIRLTPSAEHHPIATDQAAETKRCLQA